jgi:hypothetical protein
MLTTRTSIGRFAIGYEGITDGSVGYLSPASDNSTGLWKNASISTPLWSSIDEDNPIDTDFIRSAGPPSSDIAQVALTIPGGTFLAPVGVSYRYWKAGDANQRIDLVVTLKQGAATIVAWTHTDISVAPVEIRQILSDAQFAAITNSADLRLEFNANAV